MVVFWKELLNRLSICSLLTIVILVVSRFGLDGGIWGLIAPVLNVFQGSIRLSRSTTRLVDNENSKLLRVFNLYFIIIIIIIIIIIPLFKEDYILSKHTYLTYGPL